MIGRHSSSPGTSGLSRPGNEQVSPGLGPLFRPPGRLSACPGPLAHRLEYSVSASVAALFEGLLGAEPPHDASVLSDTACVRGGSFAGLLAARVLSDRAQGRHSRAGRHVSGSRVTPRRRPPAADGRTPWLSHRSRRRCRGRRRAKRRPGPGPREVTRPASNAANPSSRGDMTDTTIDRYIGPEPVCADEAVAAFVDRRR